VNKSPSSARGDARAEAATRRKRRAELEKRWLEDNGGAIAHYNRRIAEHGLLSDDAGLL
jgi:post-segregation antitoxin (ccd killing protein)